MLLNQRSQVENLSRKFGGTVGSPNNIRKVEVFRVVGKTTPPTPPATPAKTAAPVPTPQIKSPQPAKRGCNCSRRKT